MRPLRIMHVFRSPVGGLFRHVLDLAEAQAAAGHAVGLVADASTGGEDADARLEALRPRLAGGIHRVPMPRSPNIGDLPAERAVNRLVDAFGAELVHGHGAKGGLYARMPAVLPFAARRVRVYTPHGGSLHFTPGTLSGRMFRTVERALERGTDLFLFESRFAADRYTSSIRDTARRIRVVHNGVRPEEFEPVTPDPDATDLLFVGELRLLKGVDTLLQAMTLLRERNGRAPSLTLVGAGPDEAMFRTLAHACDLDTNVRFMGQMPARRAFPLGRTLVAPSRAESLPYILLEAAAAGMPIVSTRVGGVPEILGPDAGSLVPPADPAALAAALDGGPDRSRRDRLRRRVEAHFSVNAMVGAILAAYEEAFEGAGRA